MLTRVAIALSLICIGILLLSACGWNPGPADPSWVSLRYESFVLWQTTPGLPSAIIGAGHISGATTAFSATADLFPSQCTPQRRFALRGSYLPGIPPRDAVAHSISQPGLQDPDLTAEFNGLVHGTGYSKSVLPLTGSMTIQNWCGGRVAMIVEARPGPDYEHSWRSSGTANLRMSVTLTLNQTDPDSNGVAWIWGNLYFNRNAGQNKSCWVGANLIPHTLAAPATEATFADPRGVSATLTHLPTTLNPDPPREFQTTVHITGGPCDGQTFPVTLKSR